MPERNKKPPALAGAIGGGESLHCSREEIIRAARLLVAPGGIVELRALDATLKGGRQWRSIVSGYFDSPAKLADACATIGSAKGLYITANEVNAALLARAHNRVRAVGKEPTTSDHDITRRRWLLIDIDAKRPAGISATENEHTYAREYAWLIREHLSGLGWPLPVHADSGNGGHLLYRIDLPAEDGGLVERCLTWIAANFDDEHAAIDTTVHNPARIVRLYGTMACKGDSTAERPHRMARLINVPEPLDVVPEALLREFAGCIEGKAEPANEAIALRGDFDLSGWIARYLSDSEGPKPWKGSGRRWTLPACPWNPSHTGGSAFIAQQPNGAICAGCQHNSCTWTWHDLRERFESAGTRNGRAVKVSGEQSNSSSRLRTIRLADVQPERLQWLWPGRIPLGKLTLLYGDPGLGKSFLTMDIASRVSTGNGWPDLSGDRFEPGGVVLLTAEDGLADTVRPRLDAAGADVSRIEAIESVGLAGGGERSVNLADDLRLIEECIIEREDVRLFIIDPISAYCGKADSHTNAEVRGMLAPIAKLAERHGVAILAVSHLNKGAGGRAMYRAMGSLAFIAAARAGWLVVEDESDPAKRLLLPTKMNLAVRPSGLAFSLHDSGTGQPCIAWTAEPVDLTADAALAAIAGHGGDDRRGSRDEAEEWLADVLALGPLPAKDVKARAEDDGIAERTLNRAKKRLGVVSERTGFNGGAWCWRLPKIANSPEDCQPKDMATYGNAGNLRRETEAAE